MQALVLPPRPDCALVLLAPALAVGCAVLCWHGHAAAASATASAAHADMSAEDADRRWEEAAHELSTLCRRNKRAQTGAQAALVPAELASSLESQLGARRR